jgi:hypothetical protein
MRVTVVGRSMLPVATVSVHPPWGICSRPRHGGRPSVPRHQRAAADRLIDAARAVHQGTGPLSELAVDPNTQDGVVGYRRTEATPEVDQRPHRLAS